MRCSLPLLLVLCALLATPALADDDRRRTDSIDVMSQNQYLGADLDPAFPPAPNQPLFPPYLQLAAGVDLFGAAAPGPWTDAWTELRFARPGFTCCQDSDLRNRRSQLDERIDVIFSLEPPRKALAGLVLGSTRLSKTFPSRLWPSDHGQPAVRLFFD